jgi:fructan beta-fructosidase
MTPLRLGQTYEVNTVFDLDASTAAEFGIKVLVGEGEETVIGFDRSQGLVYLDRTRGGLDPHEAFPGRHEAPLDMSAGRIVLRAYVDRSSVELFVNDTIQISDLVLPGSDSDSFVPFAGDGVAHVESLVVHPLRSIWPDQRDPIHQVVQGEWASTADGIQGSAADYGLAVLPTRGPGDDVVCSVEIIGTRNGNPARILGEAAAGIALSFQDDPRDGTLVLLDREQQTVSISPLADPSRSLTTVPFPLRPNFEYRMELLVHPDHVRIIVDGRDIGRVDRPPGSHEHVALYVRNAEAIFRPQP